LREAWVVRYYHQSKYRLKTFKRERDAKAWEAQTKVDQKNGLHRPERTSITVRQAGALWLKTCEAEKLEPEAIRSYEIHLRLHVYPAIAPTDVPTGWNGQFGDLRLSKLTTPVCEDFKQLVLETKKRTCRGEFTEKTISRRTAGHIVTSFKTMLNDAQRRGLINYNPALPIRIKDKKREKAPIRIGDQIPDRVDVFRIVNAATDMWRVLIKTDSSTGLRSSEIRSLAWPRVYLDAHEIEVCDRADKKGKIGPCKSKSAYRKIQIGDDLVAELRRWREVCPPSDLDLVFPDQDGNVLRERSIRAALYEVQLRIGLTKRGPKGVPGPKYNVHSLRHFFASIMIDAGMLPKRLQELMGHANLSMTMDLYGHLFPLTSNEIDRINKAMAQVFAEAAD
jgi:integrase